MTARLLYTPRARRDLAEIWEHTLQQWGVDQAESYVRTVARHAELLAVNPALGKSCAEIRTGYFRYPSRTHVLFYRHIEDGIELVRILHERMDFGRHLS